MSWLFKALQSSDHPDSPLQTSPTPTKLNAGVKDDLSVIGQTIGRQLRGVAAFLAPPPVTEQRPPSPPQSQPSDSPSSQRLLGIRNDLVEIGGSFKSGLSLLSSNKAVTGFSKLASNFLQFQNQGDGYGDFDGVPGITEEVFEFVKEISLRSECWTDFPLSLDDDFELSDAQREHASAVESLVPSFTDLRINLRPRLGDNRFWMIYFILLLPRLSEDDFELLSAPKIIETRNILLQKLQKKRKAQVEVSNTLDASSKVASKVCERQVENITSGEKEVTEIVNATEGLEIDDEENTEQWFEESDVDTGISVNTQKNIQHEEDVLFSDLEDDSNDILRRLATRSPAQDVKATSPSGSNDWVQLNDSSVNQGGLEKPGQSTSRDKDSEGESSDWLTVDDYD